MLRVVRLLPMLLISAVANAQPHSFTDLWAGKWTVNVAESKAHMRIMKDQAITIVLHRADTMAVQFIVTGMGPNDAPINMTYDGRFDGQAYPITANGRQIGTALYRRAGSRQIAGRIDYTNGISVVELLTVEPGNKTLRTDQHVTGSKGTFDVMLKFDKSS